MLSSSAPSPPACAPPAHSLPPSPGERWSRRSRRSQLTVSTGSQTQHARDSATRPEAPAPLRRGGVRRAEPEGETKGSGKVAALLGNEASWNGEA